MPALYQGTSYANNKRMFNRDADTDKRLGDWVDSQYVLNTLQISERTLQTFRDNGTLAYSQIGHKRISSFFPDLPFIYALSALILQNCFSKSDFFRN